MRDFFRLADEFLRGTGRFAADAPVAGRLRWLALFVVVFGFLYGAVMSSLTGFEAGRYHQMLYVGIKAPILLLVTFLLCLPSFFVINTVAGLRADFGQALRAVIATQACLTLVLASLAPVTAFFYCCAVNYDMAVLFNGVVFAVGSIMAQVVVKRYYGPLIRRAPMHRVMLYVWFFLYIFVGIQMGWVLRPFIGDPKVPVVFFRQEAWGNPYVVIFSLFGQVFRFLTGDRPDVSL